MFGRTIQSELARFNEQCTIAQRLDGQGIVRHKKQSGTLRFELANALIALVLKVGIAYGQGFIDDENIGFDGGCGGKRQAHQHAAGIHPHWFVKGVANFGKGHNVVHALVNFFQAQALQLASHAHVFIACEFRVKAHA